jgi:GTP cyclohydrolase I
MEYSLKLATEHAASFLQAATGIAPVGDLGETPARMARALREMTIGYTMDPAKILSKVFDVECEEMVLVRNVQFTSLCEHHVLPFMGVAHVGYIPKKNVVGLSKLARLVTCFAMRLQVQERMTRQIASAIQDNLDPVGVGVVIIAKHSCMGHRGARQPGADMVTSTMLGALREDNSARAEFLRLAGQLH